MNISKKMLLSSMIFLSSLICYANSEMTIQEQDKLIESLYEQKNDFSSLDNETVDSCIQILKERKATLKYALAHQVGFFKNYEMFKGVFGIPYGLKWLAVSLLIPFSHYEIGIASEGGLRITEVMDVAWYIAAPIRLTGVALSLWILKNSCENLYIGWTRKKQSLAKIAKIDEMLLLLQRNS